MKNKEAASQLFGGGGAGGSGASEDTFRFPKYEPLDMPTASMSVDSRLRKSTRLSRGGNVGAFDIGFFASDICADAATDNSEKFRLLEYLLAIHFYKTEMYGSEEPKICREMSFEESE